MANEHAFLIVIIGIFVGAAILTITPWYLRLRAIQQKAEEEGVEPVLPKFGMFYIVTGGLSVVISGALNLNLAAGLIKDNPTADLGNLFIIAMFASMGVNAILNLGAKTGGKDLIVVQKGEEGQRPKAISKSDPPLFGKGVEKPKTGT
jgi:hypothetical protein